MAVRTNRLAGPQVIVGAGVWLTVYTVPAGRRTIVKWIDIVGLSAVASFGQVGSDAAGPDIAYRHFVFPANVITAFSVPDYIVLRQGERLRAFAQAGLTYNLGVFGSELVL